MLRFFDLPVELANPSDANPRRAILRPRPSTHVGGLSRRSPKGEGGKASQAVITGLNASVCPELGVLGASLVPPW